MYSSNHKGNQKLKKNRIKGRNNKSGRNRKENQNDDKNAYNAGGYKNPKRRLNSLASFMGETI